MRGSSRGKLLVIPLFSSHVFVAQISKKIPFSKWQLKKSILLVLPKCFKIKKTSYICKLLKTLYRKTFPSVYDLTFIDTAQWTHSLIKLFVLLKRANQEERVFLFLRLLRVSLYTVHKDCWVVFIFK